MVTNINPILLNLLATKRPTAYPGPVFIFTMHLLQDLGIKPTFDSHYNITVIVGDTPTIMFTAHTDTVERQQGVNNLLISEDGWVTNESGILGADDGAGMYILIRMILAKKPGLYVFFSEEEKGMIGSSNYELPYEGITHCISFDRKNNNNLITHQMMEQGCSDRCAQYFEDNFPLEYYSDPTGSYTDSYSFFDQIPECINLSCGYENEHSKIETLDFIFLESLVEACLEFDWTQLPVGEKDHTFSLHQNRIELEKYICKNPDIIAELLKSYGLTFRDVLDYEDSLYGYQSQNDYTY